MLVKLASRCNLSCDYCYVYQMGNDAWRLQPKLMAAGTVSALARNLASVVEAQGAPLSIVFHGGEPLLVGADRFEAYCGLIREHLPEPVGLHVQTNGVLLSDRILDICARHNVGISISLDGPEAIHDRHRPDRRGRPSHASVLAALKRIKAHPKGESLLSGLLAVIDLDSEPRDVYAFFKELGAPSVDFLYRDGNHDTLPIGKESFRSHEYGDWMLRLMDIYLADSAPIRIRVLDDMLRLLLGGRSVKEGVGEQDYGILVVETDGTITKNDTLKSAAGADRFETQWSVHDDLVALTGSFAFLDYHKSQRPSAPECKACSDLRICGGGMPTHRWSAERGLNNPSVFCADQKHLISAMRKRTAKLSAA